MHNIWAVYLHSWSRGLMLDSSNNSIKLLIVAMIATAAAALEDWTRILVQVTIYRRLLIGRNCHLDQSEAYDIS